MISTDPLAPGSLSRGLDVTRTGSALRRGAYDRTTLVIAHRLSTVTDADEILVLRGGEIVERGSHAALLEMGGVYGGMWAAQVELDEAAHIAGPDAVELAVKRAFVDRNRAEEFSAVKVVL